MKNKILITAHDMSCKTKNLHRVCEICKQTIGFILHRQVFALEDGNPLPKEYDVVSCSQCNFIFADVDADQQAYNYFYKYFSKYEDMDSALGGGGVSSWDKKRLTSTAEVIQKIMKDKSAKILEIGCANGGLLKILEKNGYTNLFAIDPSNACITSINESQSRIKASVGTVFSDLAEYNSEKFDLIIMCHVLEHIYDLNTAINNIRGALSSSGRLYIEVPDALGYKDFYKTPFHFFDVEHINHFTENSLKALFQRFGFKSVSDGSKSIEVSDGEIYPAIYQVFQKTHHEIESIKKYIGLSKKNLNNKIFSKLNLHKTPIAIWGIGSYAKSLLGSTDLKNCNISYLIDADVARQGKFLNGIVIDSPEILKNYHGLILITSALFTNDIINDIRSRGYLNEVIVIK